MVTRRWSSMLKVVSIFACTALLYGCGTMGGVMAPPLRIGVTADYPPIIFKQGDEIVGVEADLAWKLAAELGREPIFVEVAWEDQVPALREGRIDIIMSGMSITRGRGVHAQFSDPYVKSGLMTMVPAGRSSPYKTRGDILRRPRKIGVIPGTTADAFVSKNCPHAARVFLKKADDALPYFRGRKMDVFIHDGYSVAWVVSENESDLEGIWIPLTEEELAWGIGRDDKALLKAANAALAKWQADGSLERVLDRWVPFRKKAGW